MKYIALALPPFLASGAAVHGYQANYATPSPMLSRRNVLATAASAAATALLAPRQALAAEEDEITPLYFGVGVSRERGGHDRWF